MQQKKESELSILKGKTAVVTGSTSGIGPGVRAGLIARKDLDFPG
jgi:NAD(P)-dependent dehydrogenase (short-subunit alcohol dehydrogenase family)